MTRRAAIATDPVRRRALNGAVLALALALLLPWLQLSALQHGFGHVFHDRAAFAAVQGAPDTGHDETCCATCVAVGAVLACAPFAALPATVLLASVDDVVTVVSPRPAATPSRILRNRGPPSAG